MSTNTDPVDVTYYALDRDVDLSGVSSTGRVAYVIASPTGVVVVWNGEWGTLDWRPTMAAVEAIHGHNGATRITPLADQPDERDRARSMFLERAHPATETLRDVWALVI